MGDVDDMITLSDLSEESIMENLRKRFENKKIYTYTGTILVALNPFSPVDIYSTKLMKKYTGKRLTDNEPHIYAIAETTFANVKNFKQNQAVIISGESGAGKTESTKYILQYLTSITSQQTQDTWVEQQILEANTVLEAFGNSKTVRNNNSSRFGKFMQISFNANATHIVGASIVSYLLEKSRVVKQGETERNYHVFYQFLRGTTGDDQSQFQLESWDPDSYKYLSQSGCTELPGGSDEDAQLFERLKLALTVLKVPAADITQIWVILSAILLLGNVTFSDGNNDVTKIDNPGIVSVVANLLSVDGKLLSQALCSKRLIIRGETTFKPLNAVQAAEGRDSIVKSIYDNLFQRLVGAINVSLAPKVATKNFVGVLDIFGFEVFQFNSFEQLCINYTNEKLQQFFNQHIFKLEQEEYDKEGIQWTKIEFKDNQICVDLIEGKPAGILSLLDEETKFPKGSDDSWLQKLHTSFAKHPNYSKPRMAKDLFGIKHYAGEVQYNVLGFLEKNKDAIQEEFVELMQNSTTPFVAKLFTKQQEDKKSQSTGPAKGSAKSTASAYFKGQLSSLVTTLTSTTPHYVRCIKPNATKEAFLFDDEYLVSQLRYSGMLETIRIRKAGFTVRLKFDQFVKSFYVLIPPGMSIKDNPQTVTKSILGGISALSADEWQIGKTKVFFKSDAYTQVQQQHDLQIKKILPVLIRFLRANMNRQQYLRLKKASKTMQRYTRRYVARKRYLNTRKAVIKIQSVGRGWIARDQYRILRGEESKHKKSRASAPSIPSVAKVLLSKKTESSTRTAAADAVVPKGQLDGMFSFLEEFDDGLPEEIDEIEDIADGILDEIDELINPDGEKKPRKKKKKVHRVKLDAVSEGNIFAGIGEKTASNQVDSATGVSEINDEPVSLANVKLGSRFNLPTKQTGLGSQMEMSINPHLPELSIKHYAQRNFKTTITGAQKTKKNAKEAKQTRELLKANIDDMLVYTKVPITDSHIKPSTKDEEQFSDLSVECFSLLLKATEPVAKNATHCIEACKSFIKRGIENPDIRDELFIQLIRQTTLPTTIPKNWDSTLESTWLVFALAASSFPPTKYFSKFLNAFLMRSVESYSNLNPGLARFATHAEKTVKVLSMNGPRKFEPSIAEYNSLKTGSNLECKFYLLDGKYYNLDISANITAGDIVKRISKIIEMKDCSGWSIYRQLGNQDFALKSTDFIADLLLMEEKANETPTAEPTKEKSPKKKEPTEIQKTSLQQSSSLVFKKRIFKNPLEVILDPVENLLIFEQASQAVLAGTFPISAKIASQLAGAKAQILFGDCEPKSVSLKISQTLKDWIPKNLLNNYPPDIWISSIIPEHEKFTGVDANQARETYLEIVRGLRYYGSGMFNVTYMGFWKYAENIILAVCHSGVDFVHPKTKDTIASFSFKNVLSFETRLNSGDDRISITVRIKVKNDQIGDEVDVAGNGIVSSVAPAEGSVDALNSDAYTAETYTFKTNQGEEIGQLMREYCPITKKKAAENKDDVTDADLAWLKRDLERARANLLEKNILRIPGPSKSSESTSPVSKPLHQKSQDNLSASPTSSTTKAPTRDRRSSTVNEKPKGGLIRLFKSSDNLKSPNDDTVVEDRPQKLTSAEQLGSQAVLNEKVYHDQYDVADWEFSNVPLQDSLLNIEMDPEFITFTSFVSMYLLQLDVPTHLNQTRKQASQTYKIQSYLGKCIENKSMSDELFLQLVKQTCGYPEPDSPRVLHVWQFFAIACGVALPSIPEITEYVKAHLRLSSVTPKSKPVRKQESAFAKYCLNIFTKSISSSTTRTKQPSTEEILYCGKMSPIQVKFYFMDGQFRSLPIQPFHTFKDAITLLAQKCHLKSPHEYSIFTRLDTDDPTTTTTEPTTNTEKPTTANESIADILYKFELFTDVNSISSKVKFVLKKNLFLKSDVDLGGGATFGFEDGIIKSQLLDEIKRDKFPLFENEAIELTGTIAQALYGDASSKKISYIEVTSQILPKHYIRADISQDVEDFHKSKQVCGLTTSEANKRVLGLIKSFWSLCGAKVFEVQQSYTHVIPGECWLAVNSFGVHLLARRAKQPLVSHEFKKIANYSASGRSILLIIDDMTNGTKYVLSTSEAAQIVQLISDYISALGISKPTIQQN